MTTRGALATQAVICDSSTASRKLREKQSWIVGTSILIILGFSSSTNADLFSAVSKPPGGVTPDVVCDTTIC